ncbi:MAG: sugar transferase (PEP-CTERM system associated) [Polaribacter sp.]|jgi:sugar transferase (PEP-CTERM system associated)
MASVKLFNHHIRTPFVILIFLEFAILFGSVYLAVYLRFQEFFWQPTIISLENFPVKAVVFSGAHILGMIAMGQYQSPTPKGKHFFPFILQRVTISLILGSAGLVIVYYIFPNLLIGRGLFGYAFAASLGGMSILRTLVYHSVDGKSLRRKVLVLGTGALAYDLLDFDPETNKESRQSQRVLTPPYASYAIHGFVQIMDEENVIDEKYIVKPGDDLADYCLEYQIDEVVVAISDRRKALPVDQLLECKLNHINCIDFVAFWEREKGMLRLDRLNPSWIIFNDGGNRGAVGHMLSRFFDVLFSSVILAFMLPILLITAIMIYIESGFNGPIFYRQVRVGLNGRNFDLLKFRSMVVDAEKKGEAKWASQNDARVTRIGKFIRKVRIDELPQVLNIFRGDMSIVGPRPERPEFVDQLSEKIPFYKNRHSVKPGLAGWAQLKYPYGASDEDAYNKLQYDLNYVKNQSVLMDALILLQTIEVILLGKGAR